MKTDCASTVTRTLPHRRNEASDFGLTTAFHAKAVMARHSAGCRRTSNVEPRMRATSNMVCFPPTTPCSARACACRATSAIAIDWSRID